MPYKINGVEITQPAESHWIDRDEVAVSGLGHAIYPGVRQHELQWDFLTPAEFYTILNWYTGQAASGSVIMDLPTWGGSMWNFKSYTGAVLREPQYDVFFEQYYQSVRLLVVNVRT